MGSRLFNTAGDKLAVTPFTLPNPGCLSMKFYLTAETGTQYLFAIVRASPEKVFSIFRRASDSAIRAGWHIGGVATREVGNQVGALNAWNSVFLVWGQSPQQMDLVINGIDAGADTGWEDAYWDTSEADYCSIGSADGGSVSLCRIAQVHIWDAQDVLRQNDGRPIATELYNGIDPEDIFPQNRSSYWPIQGIYSPEPDHSDGQRHLTVSGTTFVDEGPPLISRAGHVWFPEYTAAAGQANLMPMFLGPIPHFGAA